MSDALPTGTACVAGEMRLDDGSCLPAGFQPDGCPAGERAVNGTCLAAGIQDNGCLAGEVLGDDGGCYPPGIPDGGCATGFESDGEGGCRAVLPREPCPFGTLAVPGDTTCRTLMSCGAGRWGDIAVESTTQYVDGAYDGLDSDGTAEQPWRTITEALDAASPNAIIAVAAGVYNEYVWIENKAVRLWGRCPELVEISGRAFDHAPVVVWSDADGTEIRGVSFTGKNLGLYVSGSRVHVDSVWIHHTQSAGFATTSEAGTAEVEFSNALIEHAGWVGAYAAGARATLDGVVLRDTQLATDDALSGLGFVSAFQEAPAALRLRRSLVERNRVAGGLIESGHATLEGVVVRDTVAGQHLDWKGLGLLVQSTSLAAARLELIGSIVENNRGAGVVVAGAEAKIADSVVRGTMGDEDVDGNGIQAVDVIQRASLALTTSVVDSNRHAGIAVIGADATIDASIVRRSVPGIVAPDVGSGVGIVTIRNPNSGATPTLTVTSSRIADNRDAGMGLVDTVASVEGTQVLGTRHREGGGMPGSAILARYGVQQSNIEVRACSLDDNEGYGIGVFGSDVTIDATAVRDTVADPAGELGRGMEIEDEPSANQRSSVTVRTSAFERNPRAGIVAFATDLVMEGTVVRDTGDMGVSVISDPLTLLPSAASLRWCAFEKNKTAALVIWASSAQIEGTRFSETATTDDGAHGDGIVLIPEIQQQPEVVVLGARIESNARAGIANFAGHVVVESTALECNQMALHGQSFEGFSYGYEDRGANSCGCGDARESCKVLSQNLEPPQPIGSP